MTTGRDERIKSVYEWQGGQVMVFDLDGQQLTEYQAPTEEAKERLRRAFPEHLWHRGVWRSHVVTPEGDTLYWSKDLCDAVPENPTDWYGDAWFQQITEGQRP
jgi:hypothetical protein